MINLKESFKDRLRNAMNASGMKAADVCNKTGIPKSAMSYYLSGRSEPKADRLYLLCKVLDVSEAWMLGYDVDMAKTQSQKNNDTIADAVVKMRTDNSFLSIVDALINDKEFLAAVESMHSFAVKAKDASGD